MYDNLLRGVRRISNHTSLKSALKGLQPRRGYAADGRARGNTARYINRPCRPDAGEVIRERGVWIYSKLTIRSGEQITIDYGEEYLNANMTRADCKCEACGTGAALID